MNTLISDMKPDKIIANYAYQMQNYMMLFPGKQNIQGVKPSWSGSILILQQNENGEIFLKLHDQ